jgi:signal peptidase II
VTVKVPLSVHRRRLAQAGAVAVTVTVLDQVTKALIQKRLPLGEGFWVWDGIFMISHVRNPGVAFGLFADLGSAFRVPFFIVTAAAAVWLLTSVYRQAGHLLLGRLALGLIIGGAVGNHIDRIRFGGVTDFLDFWIWTYHWPTFNVADSGITCGVGVLLFALWRAREL